MNKEIKVHVIRSDKVFKKCFECGKLFSGYEENMKDYCSIECTERRIEKVFGRTVCSGICINIDNLKGGELVSYDSL